MSKIYWLNFLIVQWFFARICYTTVKNKVIYGIVFPVVPLTGWWSAFIPRGPHCHMFFEKHNKE